MCSCAFRTLRAALAFAVALCVHSWPAEAQQRFQFLGPNECINCHDHQPERQWYEKQEIAEVARRFPAKGQNAGHINALKQLEAPKSAQFAQAIGLRDKYDPAGACVKCHGTVFQREANAGVSCESCHGPASGYLKPHQTKGAYTQSLALGLVDIVGKIPTWVQQCTSCHVMDDQRLVAAGHPSGDDFDLGEKFGPVSLHFKRKYSAADVSGISSTMVRGIIAKRRGGRPVDTGSSTSNAGGPPPPPPPPPPPATTTSTVISNEPPQRPPQAGRGGGQTAGVESGAGGGTTGGSAGGRPAVAPPTHNSPARSNSEGTGSVSASVAVAQGRLIELLTQMLLRGATVPVRTGTPPPTLAPYAGPDAALLQLQREAIALALEVLGSPPAAPAKPR